VSEIKNPTHYTNHPSGVKCIEITMCLTNGVANAVKYVWRSNEKHETPDIDIGKAIEYLRFELREFEEINTRCRQRPICLDYQTGRASGLLEHVISFEPNRSSAQFYRHIRAAIWSRTNAGRRMALEKASDLLQFYLNDEGGKEA
jgi:hypothetical protein